MSETTTHSPEEAKSEKLDVTTMSDEQLTALNDAYVASRESETPMVTLRGNLSENDDFSFRSVYDLNNLELKKLAQSAETEVADREKRAEAEKVNAEIDELQRITAAVEGKTSYPDKRTALSEIAGFRKIYDLNNIELDSFVADSKAKLAKLTEVSESESDGETAPASDSTSETPVAESVDANGDIPEVKIPQSLLDRAAAAKAAESSAGDIPEVVIPDSLAARAETAKPADQVTPEQPQGPETPTDITRSRTRNFLSRARNALRRGYDRAIINSGHAVNYVSDRLSSQDRTARRVDETDEQYEKRLKRNGRALAFGIVGVAAATLAARYLNIYDGGNGGNVAEAAIDHQRGTTGTVEKPTPVVKPVATEALKFPADALRVDKGEGLFQTMKDMGIPKDKWSETLQAAGPKLVKMGEAYRDPNIGGYGLKGDGEISKAALRVLVDTAKTIK